MGECPRWYRLLKASQYLGVPVWELEDKPWRYVLQAEAAQTAERIAAEKNKPR